MYEKKYKEFQKQTHFSSVKKISQKNCKKYLKKLCKNSIMGTTYQFLEIKIRVTKSKKLKSEVKGKC